jgi:hypothetical protein
LPSVDNLATICPHFENPGSLNLWGIFRPVQGELYLKEGFNIL